MRVWLFWLFLTFWGWSENRVFLAVIGADKESTYQIAEEVRSVRELFGLSKTRLQIARIPVQKLSAEDLKRVGFNQQSLPLLAVLQISSANNLEKVVGSPPLIMRQVEHPRAAAQLLLCRWARQQGVPIPAELTTVEHTFRPGQLAILALSDREEVRQRFEHESKQLLEQEELTGELPCYVSSYQDELLTPSDLKRLGFDKDSESVVCLVRMSQACNPSEIVQQSIVRFVGRPRQALELALRGWAAEKGRALKVPSHPAALQLLDCSFPSNAGLASEPTFGYRVAGFHYGPKAAGWLQEEIRIYAGGALVREEIRSRRQESLALDADMTIESSFRAPDRAGVYELELKVRDKFGHSTDVRRQTLEVK